MPSRTRNPIENSLRTGSNSTPKSMPSTNRCAWSASSCSRRARLAIGDPPGSRPGRSQSSAIDSAAASSAGGRRRSAASMSRRWLSTVARAASAHVVTSLSTTSPRPAWRRRDLGQGPSCDDEPRDAPPGRPGWEAARHGRGHRAPLQPRRAWAAAALVAGRPSDSRASVTASPMPTATAPNGRG